MGILRYYFFGLSWVIFFVISYNSRVYNESPFFFFKALSVETRKTAPSHKLGNKRKLTSAFQSWPMIISKE